MYGEFISHLVRDKNQVIHLLESYSKEASLKIK